MSDMIEVEIQFDTGMSMRDILSMPALKGYRIGDVKAILLSPARINDILPFLHKPSSRPDTSFEPPPGSVFRGQVFGHIAVFSNKSLNKSQALVMVAAKTSHKAEQPAPEEPSYPVYDAASAIESSAPQPAAPISMVGLPQQAQVEKAPQREAEPSTFENVMMDPYPTPSPEKLKRWTEIIPSSTRVIKPKYPSPHEEPAEEPKPRAHAEHEYESRASAPVHGDQPNANGVKYAKESDHLIRKIIDLTESDPALSFEAKSDIAIELKILKLELSKFKPNLPRITESILALSDVGPAGASIARLKECLRGLGLLL